MQTSERVVLHPKVKAACEGRTPGAGLLSAVPLARETGLLWKTRLAEKFPVLSLLIF
jgi:hypothetical protein